MERMKIIVLIALFAFMPVACDTYSINRMYFYYANESGVDIHIPKYSNWYPAVDIPSGETIEILNSMSHGVIPFFDHAKTLDVIFNNNERAIHYIKGDGQLNNPLDGDGYHIEQKKKGKKVWYILTYTFTSEQYDDAEPAE